MLTFLLFEMKFVSRFYLKYWERYRYLSEAVSDTPIPPLMVFL